MRWLFTALAVLMLTSPAQAQTAAENLNRLLSQLHSLRAQFEQLVLDGGGTRLQQSQGEMWLARPGKFRWRTAEPFPQLLISNGETLWLYDQDLEQVTQQPVDQRLSNTPALLLNGDLTRLQQNFEVEGPEQGDSGQYQLTPLSDEALFEALNIRFEAGVPIEMQLGDNLGQKTSVHFSSIETNPELDPQLFEFQVPEGVDLITQ
jgi:outer membrane lipoprotein carrier protein